MSDVHHERVLRGIPRWLLVDYLEGLGGTAVEPGGGSGPADEEDLGMGDGWQARGTQNEGYPNGSVGPRAGRAAEGVPPCRCVGRGGGGGGAPGRPGGGGGGGGAPPPGGGGGGGRPRHGAPPPPPTAPPPHRGGAPLAVPVAAVRR